MSEDFVRIAAAIDDVKQSTEKLSGEVRSFSEAVRKASRASTFQGWMMCLLSLALFVATWITAKATWDATEIEKQKLQIEINERSIPKFMSFQR